MELKNITIVLDGYTIDNDLKKRYELKGSYIIPINSIRNLSFKRDFINLLRKYKVQEIETL